MLELLGQVLQTLQPHELGQEPLLEALLAAEKTVPGPLDVGDHLALSGHVGGPVGQAELGLEGVEVRLQLGFLKLQTTGCLELDLSRLNSPKSSSTNFQPKYPK